MTSTLQVPFGRRADGRLVEVAEVERGLACACTCPGCGEPLLAKKGEVNVQHFAHQSGSDCATGAETALHLAAKQLVADKRWLRLPALEVYASRRDPELGLFEARKWFGADDAWRFDRVALEQTVGPVRPDALGFIENVGHAIEIRVTHEVDEPKQKQLALLRLPSIEVDLSSVVGRVFTFEVLEALVIDSVEHKRWLYHPRQAEWEALLLTGFEDWRQAQLVQMANRRKPSAAPASPRPSRTDVYRDANHKYRALPDADKWSRLERQLGLPRTKFPNHLRVSLRDGADVVLADHALWQAALFAQFIHGTSEETKVGKRMPTEANLTVWVGQRFGARGGDYAPRPVVRAYLSYLKTCGFLQWQGDGLYVVHDRLATPPRTPAATAPPARVAHAVSAPAAPGIQWSSTWPDGERLRQWVTEASKQGSGFDADWFAGWLVRLHEPPAADEVQEAFAAAGGNPDEVASVLRSVGVVTNTWRYFSYGEPAPWFET